MINLDISKLASEIGEPTARFVESAEEKRQRQMIFGFTGAFLVLFLVGWLVFSLLGKGAVATADGLQNDVVNLQKQNDALLQVEQHGATIAQRNKNALQILNNSPAWTNVLAELEKITPKGIVFNRFDVEKADSLKMTGQSPDYQTVSRFMISLASSPSFKNVTLNNSSLTTRESGAVVEFAISFGVSKDLTLKANNPLLKAPENTGTVPVESTLTPKPVEQVPVTPTPKPETPASSGGSSLPVL
ncbi:MAG: PilN domain-containing protein [Patescibacteria group bacterium]